MNSEVIFCAAGLLSATPLTHCPRLDDSDFVVSCFATLEDVEAFAKRFGREALPTGSRAVTLKTSGRPERVVEAERKRRLMWEDRNNKGATTAGQGREALPQAQQERCR